MNVKIQGGDDAYSNTDSCSNIAYYLEHEDYKRISHRLEVETFFDQTNQDIQKKEFLQTMDNNKAKLCKKDAKFFVMTISPSQDELLQMGNTEKERSVALKRFIREMVIPQYAEGFGKELTVDNIMYFAKIHHWRGENKELQTHAHIVISRKTKDNRIKISPKTNHQSKSKSGVVKSGFDRTNFYTQVESGFDNMFSYKRSQREKFEYLNIMKNGTINDLTSYIESELSKSVTTKIKTKQVQVPTIKEQVTKKIKRGRKL